MKSQVQTEILNIYLETYGCQMNEYDSGLLQSILTRNVDIDQLENQPRDFEMTNDLDKADWILINTCAVRENAQERIISRIKHFHQHANKKSYIGVLGCMAQNLKEGLFKVEKSLGLENRIKLIAGPDSYRQLPFLLKNLYHSRNNSLDPASGNMIDVKLDKNELYDEINPSLVNKSTTFITIMRGCNNFCAFCVVPYTRGRERSRSPESILEEADYLSEKGVKEIILLGQNVNSYSYQGARSADFSELMEYLAARSPLSRIRFTSPHPKDFPQKLLEIMARHENICPQIHLPLQAGSDEILARMKRGYTGDDFLALTEKIRKVLPDVAFSTDLIFGFPGESEDDAEKTYELMVKIRFQSAFIFKYSEREKTFAAKHYKDDVPDKVKIKRVQKAVALQQKISLELNQGMIGKNPEVLVEGKSKKSQEDLMGKSIWGHTVVFPKKNAKIGDLVVVNIMAATAATLLGNQTGTRSNSS